MQASEVLFRKQALDVRKVEYVVYPRLRQLLATINQSRVLHILGIEEGEQSRVMGAADNLNPIPAAGLPGHLQEKVETGGMNPIVQFIEKIETPSVGTQ